MKLAPIPSNDKDRLSDLKSFCLLDTGEEKIFDDITKTAASICETEVALISLVDKDRQWFKSKQGLDVDETPRDISFCGHAIAESDIFIVEDAQKDERFIDNPLVLEGPKVRFYAGVPLVSSAGHKLGTLCVIDTTSKNLNEYQVVALNSLAKQVVSYFEIRKQNIELNKIKEYFEEVQNITKTGHWQLDVATGVTSWTKEVYRIYEIDESTPIQKIDAISYYAPHERERISSDIEIAISEKSDFCEDYEFIDAKGVKKWVRSNGHCNMDSTGKVNRLFGTFQDITDLKEKEITKDRILNNISEGYWDLDLDSNIEYRSSRFYKLLGYDLSKVTEPNQDWDELIHPDDLSVKEAITKKHIESKGAIPLAYNTRYMHADKYWMWVRTEGKVVEWKDSNQALRIIGTHRDVHENKRKEEIDNQILEIQKSYIENQSRLDVFFSFLLTNTIKSTNSSGGAVIVLSDLKIINFKENLAHEDEFYLNALEEENYGENTFVYSLYDDIFIYLENPYRFNYKNELKFFKHYFESIKEIVVNLKLRESLESQREISYHNSKLASLGELAAGVGHEINNPMTIINGQVKMLLRKVELSQFDAQEMMKHLDRIELASGRVTNIVKGLKTFSRRDSSELETFSLKDLVKENISMIEDIFSKDGISITTNLSDDTLINGNKGRVEQVIINLLNNAKDALESIEDKQIHISLSASEEIASLEIKDNGKGMDKELMGHIFDPFFTSKMRSKGTGIGLSLCHKIINEHFGKIIVDSAVNEGSVFQINIPVCKKTIDIVEKVDFVSKDKLKAHILVVDDEDDIRDYLGFILEDLELDVSYAKNGEEALSVYLDSPDKFDLILSDVQMPGGNGDELLQKIRANTQIDQPKFILMTGGVNIDVENSQNKIFKMTDELLFKPFSEDDIKEKITRVLEEIEI